LSPYYNDITFLNIVVGKTTKAEILDAFGAPNVTTRDGSGRETWSYQRAATASQSSAAGAGYNPMAGLMSWNVGVGAAGSSQTSHMLTLSIKFDKSDIVSDFRSRESNF